jgi:AcrR family transcriptional regulator
MPSASDEPRTDGSREKLLASAERLFAERGYSGVSVRDIAKAAGVNSALVGYYFTNKLGLLSQVYLRHCKPLNRERSRLLSEFGRNDPGPTLEEVLDAFLRPALTLSTGSDGQVEFTRLRAVLSGENSTLLEPLIAEYFDPVGQVFVEALVQCLPHLSREDILWRFHFMVGAMYYTGSHAARTRALSSGQCDPLDAAQCMEHLIPFMAAGFRAPSVLAVVRPSAEVEGVSEFSDMAIDILEPV